MDFPKMHKDLQRNDNRMFPHPSSNSTEWPKHFCV